MSGSQYWFFANLQVLVEQAMLAHAAASAAGAAGGATAAGDGSGPSGARASAGAGGPAPGSPGWLAAAAASSPPLLPLELSVKPFPWPALTLDLGATAAALFFNMLLVFAFLQPTRAGEGSGRIRQLQRACMDGLAAMRGAGLCPQCTCRAGNRIAATGCAR